MVRFAQLVVSMVVVLGALVSFAGPAGAAPTDPVAGLIAAGVPVDVAVQAASARPVAAGQVVNIANPTIGNPGARVDGIIDRRAQTITVVQRWLEYEPSRLKVGWVNLRTGRSGISGLPNKVPGVVDGRYPTFDRAGTLPTGSGPVLLVVYGRLPGFVGLIGLSPEAYGIFTPTVRLLQV